MNGHRLLALTAVVVIALVAPSAASAKTLEFRGVVSGSPYGASSGYMAVPVLYSKQTARRAGLKSPVGLLVVKRTTPVKLPSGGARILPVGLRAGDRFKGSVPMKAGYTTSFYPRITFRSVSVYFRSKELSLGEISAAIDALRAALARLQAQNFQSQIDAVNRRLDALIASLPDFNKFALVSQLPDLSQYVKLTDLSGLLGSNTLITTLQSQVTTLTTRLNNVCTALKSATIDPDGSGPLGSIGVISLPGLTGPNACGP